MRLTILGSGTAVPAADAFPAAVLVEGGAEVVLVDAGPGVVRRLSSTRCSVADVTTILMTHYHPDHSAGLIELLFALRSPEFVGRPPLRILGGAGLLALLAGMRAVWPRWLEARGYTLEEREIEPGSFALDGLGVEAVRVDHNPESLAYRIEESATSAAVCVSGDADSEHGLQEAARSVDVFVCEAPFTHDEPHQRHLSGRVAAEIAHAAGARTLCLTHLYPGSDRARIEAEARAVFAGNVVIARDLLEFDMSGCGN